MAVSRREFVARSLLGLLTVLGLGILLPVAELLAPARDRKRKVVFVPLIAEYDLPRAGVKKTELTFTAGGRRQVMRVFIVVRAGGPLVLSATCSHLGCLVNYHKDKKEFICPCHGGRYDLNGKNIGGPPPLPLTRLPLRTRAGMILAGVKV